MELNTCTENSVVGSNVWKKLYSARINGRPTLKAYGGNSLPVLGAKGVFVTFKIVQHQLELVVDSNY